MEKSIKDKILFVLPPFVLALLAIIWYENNQIYDIISEIAIFTSVNIQSVCQFMTDSVRRMFQCHILHYIENFVLIHLMK